MAKQQPQQVKQAPQPKKKMRARQQVRRGEHGGTQLVLIEDVPHLGKQGQVVEVKPGYARNYLLPNSLAVVPTEHNLRLLDHYKIRVQKAKEARVADLKVLADQISRTQRVTIEANATEEGHLYGSVGPQEISRAMKGKNLQVDPDQIRLTEPIKECGTYSDVTISLGYDIETKIEVWVVPQAAGKK